MIIVSSLHPYTHVFHFLRLHFLTIFNLWGKIKGIKKTRVSRLILEFCLVYQFENDPLWTKMVSLGKFKVLVAVGLYFCPKFCTINIKYFRWRHSQKFLRNQLKIVQFRQKFFSIVGNVFNTFYCFGYFSGTNTHPFRS